MCQSLWSLFNVSICRSYSEVSSNISCVEVFMFSRYSASFAFFSLNSLNFAEHYRFELCETAGKFVVYTTDGHLGGNAHSISKLDASLLVFLNQHFECQRRVLNWSNSSVHSSPAVMFVLVWSMSSLPNKCKWKNFQIISQLWQVEVAKECGVNTSSSGLWGSGCIVLWLLQN